MHINEKYIQNQNSKGESHENKWKIYSKSKLVKIDVII